MNQKEKPANMKTRDKFLVQAAVIEPELAVNADMKKMVLFHLYKFKLCQLFPL
jgi:cell division protein YceG involved in septum cleavage